MTDLVYKAIRFAQYKHKNQKDDTGADYFEAHLCQVVRILEQVTQNEHILAAGYLHDTIEDTDTTYSELFDNFGPIVANLVMEVTKEGQKDEYGYFFRRLHSQWGIMLKFADRLSNLSRMEAWSEERRAHYLRKSKFWKDGHDKPIRKNTNENSI